MTVLPGRPKTWVADALTLSNGIFGFLSILTWAVELGPLSGLPDPIVAGAYVGLGMVADGVDGVVARAWGSTGLGKSLDSINDVVTFSVAPAVFLVKTYESFDGVTFRTVLSIAAVAFVIAGMLRLARHQENSGGRTFSGLPTPWSAATLIVVLLAGAPPWGGIVLAMALAALNLSSVPYPKTRGAFVKPALAIVVVSLAVIGAMLAFESLVRPAVWVGVAVGVGMVLLAPLFVVNGE